MNARDFEKKKSEEKVNPQNVLRPAKTRVFIWDKLSDMKVTTSADKVKFLITFIIIGLACILFGDVCRIIAFKATGTALQIVGWLIIAAGFFVPVGKMLDENS
jgi:hypothetical protein